MTAAHADAGTDEGPEVREARYQLLLGIVEKNTAGPNDASPHRAGMEAHHVAIIAGHAGETDMARKIERYLSRAEENGDVVAYPDRDGHTRYARKTADGLAAVVAQHHTDGDPPRAVMTRIIHPAIAEVRDDGE